MAFNASFWSFAGFGPYLAAIPYTQDGALTGPYLWSNQGASNAFIIPSGAPGCRVGATAAQFLMVGDIFRTTEQLLFTGDGSTTGYSGSLPAPLVSSGTIADQAGHVSTTFANGVVVPQGYVSGGTIDNVTGELILTFNTAPPSGDIVYATSTQTVPYRVWWPAIGNPTNWPVPLTDAAIAAQSGYQDLQPNLGQIMFIAGYPLYALIFQRFGITRASYQGGAVVFSFQPYEFTRGCVAHGAAVQVGPLVYYIADDGFYVTDGANVMPIGTDASDSGAINAWFWANVNQDALEAIRAAYDGEKRCVFFAIPTGTNTLPDTLLSVNALSGRWTRSPITSETIWTGDNGADGSPPDRQLLGVVSQLHVPCLLNGSTLNGYLESLDVSFADSNRRLTSGVRPMIKSTDTPQVVIGTRDSLEDAVVYTPPSTPDSFSKIAPVIASGVYTRLRLSSSAASSNNGGTLLMETEGMI